GGYRRDYTWNERNLLIKSDDKLNTVIYRYGDDGQRALKFTQQSNSETLYFNNFYSVHQVAHEPNHEHGLRVSKHIFVGNSRLVTAMTHADNHGDTTEQTEKRYYYHADHLQSAQFITNAKGEQYEHIEYTPYGELWIEETAPGIDKLPFRFTGKELDEETGLYYYGARYLDPKYSRWLSGDPALGEYIPQAPVNDEAKKHNENLPGMGGIYNTVNLHVYHYAGNNPVKYVDPNGEKILDVSTTLVQENGEEDPLGKGNTTIASHGCVLTAYTRIANAISAIGERTLQNANSLALKKDIYDGNNKNLIFNSPTASKLVNSISILSEYKMSFYKSLNNISLNEYGSELEKLSKSEDLYAITIRVSNKYGGHTVNMNSDGIIVDTEDNYTIKINNTSEKGYLPSTVVNDIITDSSAIIRIDIFKIEKVKTVPFLPE
ncbi:RHS repeat domain-containing protein, partial [Treponema denticola]